MDAVQVLNALAALRVEVRADGDRLLLNAPKGTIGADLAEAIRTHKPALLALLRDVASAGDRGIEAPIPVTGGREGPLGLAQERLWLAQRLDPESAVYNLPGSWRLRGPFDSDAMDRALHAFVARHDILRCVFVERDGTALLSEISAPLALDHPDFSGISELERDAALHGYLDAEARRPFDLATECAARFAVIRLAADDHVLMVVTHAVIWDGWSFDVFLGDVAAFFGAFGRGESDPQLPAMGLVPRYSDYAAWQRDRVDTPRVQGQLAAWRRFLAPPLPSIELPIDRPRPSIPSHTGSRAYLRFPESVVAPLAALARAESTTTYTVLLTAWETLLHRYSGQTDLVITTPVRGRERPELELGIGIYTNTLFFRTNFSGDPTFREAVRRTKAVVLDAFENQEAPVDQVIAELSRTQDLARTSLFQTTFSYQNTNNRIISMGPCTCAFVAQAVHSVYAELNFWVKDARGALVGAVDYRADLFDATTIERLIAHLETVLVEVGNDPDRPVSRLPLLVPADHAWLQQLPASGREGRADDSVTRTAERAHETPDAVAISGPDGPVTFADLEARVRRGVDLLLDRGVRPGATEPLVIARTVDSVVLAFAILRLGATLAMTRPVDPASRLVSTPAPGRVALLTSEGSVSPEAWRWATHAIAERLALTPTDRVVSLSPAGVAFLVEVAASLGAGATVVLPSDATLGDAWDLRDLIEADEDAPSALIGDGAAVSLLVEEGLIVPGMRLVVWEALEPALETRLAATQAESWVVDGPRATAGVLVARAAGQVRDSRSSGPPLPGVKVQIVDALDALVPVGVHGTVQVVVPGGKPLRTEVVARWLPDGSLSRLEDGTRTLRRGGQTVPLMQLAQTLREVPGVRDAHIGLVMSAAGSRLVAWYVLETDGQPGGTTKTSSSATDLRARLADRFPPEAVPGVLLEVPELRRPGGGAVDERGLPNPFETPDGQGAEPRTPGEQTLAAVWSDLLGRPRIRATANFFELGGSSLLALRAVVEVERRTGRRVDPRLYFYKSLRELAIHVDTPASN